MNPANLIGATAIVVLLSVFSSKAQPLFVTTADKVEIAYEVQGNGIIAVVLVHGWSCDRSYWNGQLQLSRNYTVVAVDLGGHGESGVIRKAWTIEAFGEDVAAVVKKHDLKQVVLVGHSMGSNVIAEAARRLPGRVIGLVLVDQYNDLGPGLTPEAVRTFAARFQTNFVDSVKAFVRGMFISSSDSALVERVATDMASADPPIALNALEYTLDYSRKMPRTLEELKLPTVAINVNSTPTDLPSMNRYGVEVMTMSGVGHFLMMEKPEDFNKLLEAAIRRFVEQK